MKAQLTPTTVTEKTLKWSVNNTEYATISSAGVLKGKKSGEVTIKVTDASGNIDSYKINVVIPVTGIKITNGPSITINVGDTYSVYSTVSPSNATNKSLIWSSSNNNIATVSKNGIVTGVSSGKVTIKATSAENKNIVASITVNVEFVSIKSVKIKNTSPSTLNFLESRKLTLQIDPPNAMIHHIEWSSSNNNISVSSNGSIKVNATNGQSKITVKVYQTATKVGGTDSFTFNIKASYHYAYNTFTQNVLVVNDFGGIESMIVSIKSEAKIYEQLNVKDQLRSPIKVEATITASANCIPAGLAGFSATNISVKYKNTLITKKTNTYSSGPLFTELLILNAPAISKDTFIINPQFIHINQNYEILLTTSLGLKGYHHIAADGTKYVLKIPIK